MGCLQTDGRENRQSTAVLMESLSHMGERLLKQAAFHLIVIAGEAWQSRSQRRTVWIAALRSQ